MLTYERQLDCLCQSIIKNHTSLTQKMTSKSRILRTLCVLLFQLQLVLSLPLGQIHLYTTRQVASDRSQTTKRSVEISNSTTGLIVGGAVALFFIALFIGLGAASIAFFGSLEWGEWRGKTQEGIDLDNEKKSVESLSITTETGQSVRRGFWPWKTVISK